MRLSDNVFLQRALGAVVGSAVGDALGAPFEFGPAGQFSSRFPEPVVGGIGEMVGGGGFSWEPAEFTDDTQMAIVQAESLLACGGFDGADLFERFGLWAAGANDVGIQTSTVLRSRLGWRDAAADRYRRHPMNAAGNGSLMRATPTAVYAAARLSAAASVGLARATSALTHGDPAAGWGVALHLLLIRSALEGDDPIERIDDLLALLPADQERYRRMLAPDWTPDDAEVPDGTVWGCLATAVWAVRHTTNFADAVVAALELGGDTDTVAAVTGGLAGAVYGIQRIPSRWVTYLHGVVDTADGVQSYRSRDLHELTLRLIDRPVMPVADVPPPEPPMEITPGVHIADLDGAAAVPVDWAVISLCRVEDRFLSHPVRREVFLIDREADHNEDLVAAVEDCLASIAAFRAEDRQVVVHCHWGASRTGLIARAWLMRTNGWDAAAATTFIEERWPRFEPRNQTFGRFLEAFPG